MNILSNFQLLKAETPESPPNYKKLINFLLSQKLLYGYSNEDIAYSLNFLSEEKIIYSGILFIEFEERCPGYTKVVNSQKNVSYIFNIIKQPEKKMLFEKLLKSKNISFKKGECSAIIGENGRRNLSLCSLLRTIRTYSSTKY